MAKQIRHYWITCNAAALLSVHIVILDLFIFLHACAAGTELHTVKGMVGALMHELEVILHEYLSFNWDRLDDILAANKHLLEPEGPALPSPRPKDATETTQSKEGQVCISIDTIHHGLYHLACAVLFKPCF